MTVINIARKIIIPAGVALCVGSLMTGCCTKKSSKSSYETTHTTTQASTQPAVNEPSGASMEGQTVIPLYQENLSVSKQDTDAGQVHLRKVVTTEKTSIPVELRKESLEIIREPAGASTVTSTNAKAFENQDVVINLKEEQPVLQKQVVQSGSIVVKKNTQMEQRTISGDVRKEDVQVDKGNSGAKVTFQGGTVNEAAGAQPQQQPQPQPQTPPDQDQMPPQENPQQ